ncbi:phage tail assembly chaperone [Metabacillus sp. B2-18]|uniref:phage tail assembly chaperone n=1 Tax=Metabacillus sp. B2-18 TaxID=2897333 RepID=UPI001E57B7B4|nr:XkdN-like protein [Metabacillus sp. B2-18]UGB31709.1 XkdN-like protein [Metabacillus sp. B2-18]
MSNFLLNIDPKKFELPSKQVKIKRLGEDAVFTLKGLDNPRIEEIREMATNKDGELNIAEFQAETILSAVIEPNLRNGEYLKHFGVATPYDLVDKLFLPGERQYIYGTIQDLSGFADDAIEEVKN